MSTGATNPSSIGRQTQLLAMNAASTSSLRWNWDKNFTLYFNIRVTASIASGVVRVQLKETNTLGVLGELGIGLKVLNLALW